MNPDGGGAASGEIAAEEIARLQTALADHQKLWREANHRFRNNLQILSSITSIRLREAEDHDFRWAMTDLRHRIGALAAIYQEMSASSDPRKVYVDAFLPAICTQMVPNDGGKVTVSTMVPHMAIAIDAAIVLAMLTIEAIQLAPRQGQAQDDARLRIIVQIFSRAPGHSTLVIANDAPDGATQKFPVAEALIAGYVRQLRGEIADPRQKGLRVDFPVLR
ncbi:MAG TPA: sensor histidine kinase [Ferrovibrio sp.]|jgi:two-component sensor histidine kinase|uniref:sensor histidine kinase n=1 Tax=Ferrovibrio sp. TaxID=1917215 RepID=UPI002ED627A6